MSTHDVIVAGAGPAGLAAAIHAATAGYDVVVVDPHGGHVIDKACGEGIMPGGVEALDRLGVHPAGRPFMGIRYALAHGPHTLLDGGTPLEAFGNFPSGSGLGVRRTVLSEALIARAMNAGVRFREDRVTRFTQEERAVVLADGTRTRWLIAADGLRSPVRRELGLERAPQHPPRFGLRRHYALSPWSMHVEVHFAADAEAYVTPVANDLVGVAILFAESASSHAAGAGAKFDALLARFPQLQERLVGGASASAVRGAGPFEHRVRKRVDRNVLLIGDAAGYLDPLTGEGVALGLATAEAAVAAILSNNAASYERRYHALTRRYFALTSTLLAVVRRPSLHRPLIQAARAMPSVFQATLGALSHLGAQHASAAGPLPARSHDAQRPEAPVV